MKYRQDKYGNNLSVLGYGCMRFSKKGSKVDLDKAEEELMAAFNAGVNYYDTAYSYPGNEIALGELLKRTGIRDSIYIATKLPYYRTKSLEDCERIFCEELERLGTDHIDYYLIHMLTDIDAWNRLCEMGIEKWIEEKKRSGKIRQIGFSYHGNSEMFEKIIDSYDWEFAQIQYNYLDENSQAGRKGLKYAASKNIPVFIMEPLRGGKMVENLPKDALWAMNESEVKRTPAEWALRWLWDQPEVTLLLSGMNSMEQVRENVRLASEAEAYCMTEKDHAVISKVRDAINKATKVPCTACRYCVPCPKGVDIPTVFSAYNRYYTESRFQGLKDNFILSGMRREYQGPSNCISCGKCLSHCPQHIDIPSELKKAKSTLEFPGYGIARKVARVFLKIDR